ncbi:MAG: hypothetical protein WBA68_05730 [Alteraurantiacibacter sp.]
MAAKHGSGATFLINPVLTLIIDVSAPIHGPYVNYAR